MNTENYDQVTVPADVVGDQAAYLQPEMKVKVSVFRRHAGRYRTAAAGDAGSRRDRAHDEGPDRVLILQARHALQRRPHHGAAAYRRGHASW